MRYALIDESGRLYDRQDRILVFAVLVTKTLVGLDKIISKVRRRIDRHFTYITQREKFNQLLRTELTRDLFIEHLDSQQNPIISLADFVAGATRFAYVRGEKKFKKIIDKLIAEENLITWKGLKQKSGKS